MWSHHPLCVYMCVQVQFQVGLAVDGTGMRAVNIVSSHAFLRGHVESIKGQGQVGDVIHVHGPSMK